MNRKALAKGLIKFSFLALFLASLVFLVINLIVPVSASSNFDITILNPTKDACLVGPVRVNGIWDITKNPPGELSQYNVQIDWGDGSVNSALNINRTEIVPKEFFGTYDTNPGFNHSYISSDPCGSFFNIIVKLYHSQPPGSESGDAMASLTIKTCTSFVDNSSSICNYNALCNSSSACGCSYSGSQYCPNPGTVINGTDNKTCYYLPDTNQRCSDGSGCGDLSETVPISSAMLCNPTVGFVGCNSDNDCPVSYTSCGGNSIVSHDFTCDLTSHTCKDNPSTIEDCNNYNIDSCNGNSLFSQIGTCIEHQSSCAVTNTTTNCVDSSYCNGQETCSEGNCVSGTPIDCSQNDIPGIGICTNNPDNNPFTWDYFAGFTSVCDEVNDICPTGTLEITSTCSFDSCNAECDTTHTCADSTCSEQYNDYCTDLKLTEYDNDKILDSTTVSDSCGNSCQEDCTCTDCSVDCSAPQTNTYCVKDICGAECDSGSSTSCTTSDGYSGTQNCSEGCTLDNCITTEYCGDGIKNGPETCDDGSLNGQPYYCNNECTGQTPTLVVIVHVNNGNDGTAVASDFTVQVTGTNVQPSATFPGNETGTVLTLDAGYYTVDETVLSGYDVTFSNCAGTISINETKTCEITNDYNPEIPPVPETSGRLIVVKNVINDDEGTASESDFTMYVDGTNVSAPSFAGSREGVTVNLSEGSYLVTETGPSGYKPFISSYCYGTIASGEIKTCTIINDDQPGTPSENPTLIVFKLVIGGTMQPSDFTITVSGTNVQPSATFQGSEYGTTVTMDAGTYGVDEQGPYGYTPYFSTNCFGTIANGETKACIIVNFNETNSPTSPTLIVFKQVINDNGGTKQPSNFIMHVNGTNVSNPSFSGSENGVPITLDAGTDYEVTEDATLGYTATILYNCNGTVPDNQFKTCTIINDDIQPLLTVTKVVVNNNDGTKVVADFPLFVGATSVTSGVQNGFDVGTYIVSETQDSGYTATISGDCESNGTIILSIGDVKSCTITNDDIFVPTPPTPSGPTGGGGGGGGSSFAIVILSPVTTITQAAGSSATYTVNVQNIGGVSGTLSLSITGLPSSYYSVSSPITLSAGAKGTLNYTLALPSAATSTRFTVVVNATGAGGLKDSKTYAVNLTVTPATVTTSGGNTTTTGGNATQNITQNVTAPVVGLPKYITGAMTAIGNLASKRIVQYIAAGILLLILLILLIRFIASRRKPWRSRYGPSYQKKLVDKVKGQIKKVLEEE